MDPVRWRRRFFAYVRERRMMIFAMVIAVWVVAALLAALVIGRVAADRSSHAVWRPVEPAPVTAVAMTAEIPAQRTPAHAPEQATTS